MSNWMKDDCVCVEREVRLAVAGQSYPGYESARASSPMLPAARSSTPGVIQPKTTLPALEKTRGEGRD
jgi:hypothetical protein